MKQAVIIGNGAIHRKSPHRNPLGASSARLDPASERGSGQQAWKRRHHLKYSTNNNAFCEMASRPDAR
jgi:hypothetical protein